MAALRILFTGASSFTGHWFVQELSAAGHHVTATFRGPASTYEGVREERVARLAERCHPVFCRFGDERFLDVIRSEDHWDVLCHHGADVTDYKSPDFDVARALENNTHDLRAVLEAIGSRGCTRVVLTGSVFEPGEGAGSEGLPAFSPYGLSKGLTSQVFRYFVGEHGMRLGKFVISNPFGPYEEPRFTSYLARTWLAGESASVRTPAYVRDNIHVSLLAKAYARFVAGDQRRAMCRFAPSGYVESQGAFALRFADAMRRRLSLACELELAEQREFPEPRVRINTDVLDSGDYGWNYDTAWSELAAFYRRNFGARSDANASP